MLLIHFDLKVQFLRYSHNVYPVVRLSNTGIIDGIRCSQDPCYLGLQSTVGRLQSDVGLLSHPLFLIPTHKVCFDIASSNPSLKQSGPFTVCG